METHWLSGLHITLSWSKKIRGEISSKGILHSEYFGLGMPLCCHYIDCCFVSGHSDITSFRPWSPIATGNRLDRIQKFPKFAQASGTVDVFVQRSGISEPTSRRLSAMSNFSWMMDPTRSREMPRFSATDLAENGRSSKVSLWIFSIIYGVVTV
jgi:hypothetical protein